MINQAFAILQCTLLKIHKIKLCNILVLEVTLTILDKKLQNLNKMSALINSLREV